MSPADDNSPDLGGDDILAAEYVVGVLPADERREAAARIERDQAFARLVDQWEVRLSPLASAYPEIAVPAAVKAAIDRRLFARSAEAASRASLWSSLAFWRGLAAAAVALAALIAVAYFVAPPSDDSAQRYVASLAPQQSDVHYFVVYDARTQDIGLSHVTGARPEGRDFELWVIEQGKDPVSLGVIPVGQSVHLAVAQAIRDSIAAGAVFAISLEPPGGSPTGQPTGPVVASGDLHNV
jgi:anti-sigma-K factor RskA